MRLWFVFNIFLFISFPVFAGSKSFVYLAGVVKPKAEVIVKVKNGKPYVVPLSNSPVKTEIIERKPASIVRVSAP